MPPKINKLKQNLIILSFITLACFLGYFNSLANPFIWDDEALVVKNTLIRSWQNIPQAFSNDLYYGITTGSNFYRPIQTISYIFDFHFWQLDPFGYHLTNIFLQIAVSFLVFLLIFSLFKNMRVALASALLFAVSPLHTEAVTYVSGRADMFMGLFTISSLLLFIRSQEKTSKRSALFYCLSLGSFILALLSKEVAVVFPFVILGYVFYLLRGRLKEKYYLARSFIPFLSISFIYVILRVSLFSFATLSGPALAKIPWFIRLSVLPKVILTYIKLLLMPTGLHMSWELLRPTSAAGILLAILALGILIFTCWYFLKAASGNKPAAFMLLWSIIFFIPQSGVFPINAFVSEHFIYLSSISFFLLVAFSFYKNLRKELFFIATGLLIIFYLLLTAGRNFEWRNPEIFYKSIIKYSPDSFQAHNNLGLIYERMGRISEAMGEYKRALSIKPDLTEGRANLASLYFKLKDYKMAEQEYLRIENSPLGAKAGEVENNLGNIYEATGEISKAVIKYNQALKLDPSLKFTHFNLARIYFGQNNPQAACVQILYSLDSTPKEDDSLILKSIGDFLSRRVNVNNAADFYNNLGIYFAGKKFWGESVSAFNCALELDPGSADYLYNLGLAYLNWGKKNRSEIALKEALRINPNHIRAKSLITKK